MTAPLCGRVSIPPEAIEITRCMTSGGMWNVLIASVYAADIVLKAMPIPPDADPVIPASAVVVTAPLTSGSVNVCDMPLLTILKPEAPQ